MPIPAAFYTPETEVGGGVGIVHAYRKADDPSAVPHSSFIPAIIYTQRNQLIARALLEHYSDQGRYLTNMTLAYTNYPDRYYGNGGDTRLEDEELFTEIYGSAEVSIVRQFVNQTYFGPVVRYEEFALRELTAQGRLAQGDIVGSDRGTISGAGVRALHNSRDNNFVPRAGQILELSWVRHATGLGSTYDFSSSQARWRLYHPLSKSWIMATDVVLEDRSGEVPFRKLALLGGQYLLRGYFLGRYRDSKLGGAQLDFRLLMTERLGFVAFASTGWVGPKWEELAANDFHHSVGGGLRYVLDLESRINLRVDYGVGKDSSGIYVGVGEAF